MEKEQRGSTQQGVERFATVNDAAKILGIPTFKLRRAARAGAFPIYRLGNRRAMVRLSEIIAAMEATRTLAGKP